MLHCGHGINNKKAEQKQKQKNKQKSPTQTKPTCKCRLKHACPLQLPANQ